MGPQLIQWYFCQLVIKYAIRRDTPCSKADTLLRLRGARSRLRTGGIPFSVLIITKLAGVGKLLRYVEPDAGCELTEEHSDVWEPHIANPEA